MPRELMVVMPVFNEEGWTTPERFTSLACFTRGVCSPGSASCRPSTTNYQCCF